MSKVDSSGKYLPFNGVTVVASAITSENGSIFNELYLALSNSKKVMNNFSLLPVASYHMTTMDLVTERVFPPGDFVTFVDSKLPWFSNLHTKLVEVEFSPTITVESAQVHGVIMLIVKLDAAQDNKLREIAKDFCIEEKIPPRHHITFGYCYKSVSQEELWEVTVEVNRIFEEVWERHGSRQLTLEPTKLCYFRDMCEFVPWDAATNPF